MGYLLFAIFLVVPLIEIALFIVIGGEIGVVATMAAVVLTALAGAVLVRRQGLATLERARREVAEDRVPAGALGEGLAILIAGALLLTPGFFTDTIGFALLVPPLRRRLVALVGRWIVPRLVVVARRGRPGHGRPGRGDGRDTVIEGEAVEVDEERPGGTGTDTPWRRP